MGQGKLPNGTFGDIAFEQAKAIIDPLIEHIEPLISSPESPAHIQLIFQPFHQDQESTVTLTGHLKSMYYAGVVNIIIVGGIRPVDVLMAWIDHLIANSLGLKKATHLIGYNNTGCANDVLPQFNQNTSLPLLGGLGGFIFPWLRSPLVLFP